METECHTVTDEMLEGEPSFNSWLIAGFILLIPLAFTIMVLLAYLLEI